jgi:hypothetical protein
VFVSDGRSKTLQKTFCKKVVSKSFYNKIDQKKHNRFSFDFPLSRFWAFLGEGVQKHDKKYQQINLTLVLFWLLTRTSTTGVTDLSLQAPCQHPTCSCSAQHPRMPHGVLPWVDRTATIHHAPFLLALDYTRDQSTQPQPHFFLSRCFLFCAPTPEGKIELGKRCTSAPARKKKYARTL